MHAAWLTIVFRMNSLWGILALKLDPGMSIEAYTTREVAFRSRLVAYARGLGAAHFDLQKSALLNDMDLVSEPKCGAEIVYSCC